MIDKSKLCYISHPYTSSGDPDKNRVRSIIIATALEHFNKLKVINPIDFLPRMNDEEAMRRCRLIYDACDVLILCEGWEKSKGCNIEFQWALEDGKPIYIVKQCGGMFEFEVIEYEAA
jgi:hypothetical protein